jgi:hypothetical protein
VGDRGLHLGRELFVPLQGVMADRRLQPVTELVLKISLFEGVEEDPGWALALLPPHVERDLLFLGQEGISQEQIQLSLSMMLEEKEFRWGLPGIVRALAKRVRPGPDFRHFIVAYLILLERD